MNFECVGATIGRPRAFNERPYIVAVRICPRIYFCGESISKNAFRRFESVYRPEKNEIVRCTMKSSLRSDEIFGVSPQMKLNPPPSPAVRQISSRSDFIHRRWISSVIGGFSCKKHLLAQVLFAGWDGRIRTDECRSQSPVPYRLATSQ